MKLQRIGDHMLIIFQQRHEITGFQQLEQVVCAEIPPCPDSTNAENPDVRFQNRERE